MEAFPYTPLLLKTAQKHITVVESVVGGPQSLDGRKHVYSHSIVIIAVFHSPKEAFEEMCLPPGEKGHYLPADKVKHGAAAEGSLTLLSSKELEEKEKEDQKKGSLKKSSGKSGREESQGLKKKSNETDH
nr:unnamed protein product [Haemonchus contortus]